MNLWPSAVPKSRLRHQWSGCNVQTSSVGGVAGRLLQALAHFLPCRVIQLGASLPLPTPFPQQQTCLEAEVTAGVAVV